jgi:hypothetical protein
MRVLRRESDGMTMYLSNADVRPTGYEPAEFIEPPTRLPAVDPFPSRAAVDDDAVAAVDAVDAVEVRVP